MKNSRKQVKKWKNEFLCLLEKIDKTFCVPKIFWLHLYNSRNLKISFSSKEKRKIGLMLKFAIYHLCQNIADLTESNSESFFSGKSLLTLLKIRSGMEFLWEIFSSNGIDCWYLYDFEVQKNKFTKLIKNGTNKNILTVSKGVCSFSINAVRCITSIPVGIPKSHFWWKLFQGVQKIKNKKIIVIKCLSDKK